jgi:hypothetical protein
VRLSQIRIAGVAKLGKQTRLTLESDDEARLVDGRLLRAPPETLYEIENTFQCDSVLEGESAAPVALPTRAADTAGMAGKWRT